MDDFFCKFLLGCTLAGVTINDGLPPKPLSVDSLSKVVSIATYYPKLRTGEPEENFTLPQADCGGTIANSTAWGSETFWGLN
jgi:hypothetical protein